ncbi:MAG: 30S ribosome-binding factor RbfA [Myxococcales bacterium]|nr:30S ribosome-binding factor RbfA [Myxococcales bacterium]
MRDELAQLIAREVKDPRVTAAGVVGVARVECTADFSVARVYVSIYATDAVAAKAMAGLATAAGFLRGPLARRLHLGKPPELRFIHDRSAEIALQLTAVVREDAAKAIAAGRTDDVPGAPPLTKPAIVDEVAADEADTDEVAEAAADAEADDAADAEEDDDAADDNDAADDAAEVADADADADAAPEA